MLLPFVIVLCMLLAYKIKVSDNAMEHNKRAFWDKETKANSTRRKDISNLPYINVDTDILNQIPEDILEDMKIKDLREELLEIIKKPLLNLNYISNTDLKLEYGAPNLPYLSDCDLRYTSFIRKLSNLASLIADKDIELASKLYEYNIELGSDITNDYEALWSYYNCTNNDEAKSRLIISASSLNSIKKDIILKKLDS